MCLVVPSLEDDLELRKNHQDNPKVQCLCTINLVLDPMIENTSTGTVAEDEKKIRYGEVESLKSEDF